MALSEAEKRKIEDEETYRAKIRADLHPKLQIRTKKSKGLVAILAILFGGIGIHKFYLGQVGWGIIYLVFCWTWIPMILGFIEGIIYLCMSEKTFDLKYS